MRRRAALVCVVALSLQGTAMAVSYTAGLMFADGKTEATINLTQTATLQIFASTADQTAAMKQFLVGFSASTGPNDNGLSFARTADTLSNWNYGSSNLTGALANRFSTAAADTSANDVHGPFTRLVVDSLVISALTEGDYRITPDILNFDVIIADRVATSPGNSLEAGYGSVLLHVTPEPGALMLLAVGGVLLVRRK